MITENEIMELFSDIIYDDERSFSDKVKAAEFIMKYKYNKQLEDKEDRVIIIDDIRK